jgi:hypothetical protein
MEPDSKSRIFWPSVNVSVRAGMRPLGLISRLFLHVRGHVDLLDSVGDAELLERDRDLDPIGRLRSVERDVGPLGSHCGRLGGGDVLGLPGQSCEVRHAMSEARSLLDVARAFQSIIERLICNQLRLFPTTYN